MKAEVARYRLVTLPSGLTAIQDVEDPAWTAPAAVCLFEVDAEAIVTLMNAAFNVGQRSVKAKIMAALGGSAK